MGLALVSMALFSALISPVFADGDAAATTYPSQSLPFDPGSSAVSAGGINSVGMLVLGHTDPVSITYNIIAVVLSFLGMGFLVLLLYAGWLWVSARGSEEQITKAKQIILQALIGFIIIFAALGSARLIYQTVYDQFIGADASGPNDLEGAVVAQLTNYLLI